MIHFIYYKDSRPCCGANLSEALGDTYIQAKGGVTCPACQIKMMGLQFDPWPVSHAHDAEFRYPPSSWDIEDQRSAVLAKFEPFERIVIALGEIHGVHFCFPCHSWFCGQDEWPAGAWKRKRGRLAALGAEARRLAAAAAEPGRTLDDCYEVVEVEAAGVDEALERRERARGGHE